MITQKHELYGVEKHMSAIIVENLTFSYPGSYDNIFENTSFQLDTSWKLGLVGRNGRGKTTLCKLLMNQYEYTGKIICNEKFVYFPCKIENKERMTIEILQEVCPSAEDWEFMKEMSSVDLDIEILYKPFDILSNGEQTKILLVALFMNDHQFLLIDEPTNHLVVESRELVSKYLKSKKGYILISHDRMFLDECIDHILTINKSSIEVYHCDFSTWLENFENQQKSEMLQNIRINKDIKKLQEAARKNAEWSNKSEKAKKGAKDKGFVSHKATKLMQKSKNLETRQNRSIEEKSKLLKNYEYDQDLKIYPLEYHSELLVEYKDVSMIYDDNLINSPVSFSLKKGDRVVLNGKNGSGKSSLIKALVNGNIQHRGDIFIASNLIISYIPQDTSFLTGSLTDYAVSKKIDESLFKAILQKMGFTKIHFERNIEEYSEGQKKKVLVAGSLCEKAHIYVWDEPLNYIDMFSRIQIERLINTYQPTMIFIEHDRLFQNTVSTKTINVV